MNNFALPAKPKGLSHAVNAMSVALEKLRAQNLPVLEVVRLIDACDWVVYETDRKARRVKNRKVPHVRG